jgi:CRP-like cAMP-binding protein
MVTHDSSLARRVTRTVIIADGEMVNENVVRALPSVTPALMLEITRKAEVVPFPAGAVIIQQGEPGERFYILTSGTAEVTIQRPDGVESIAAIMGPGQYVGEISLFSGRPTAATVRADGPVETLALDKDTFQSLLDESQAFRDAMRDTVAAREEHNREVAEGPVQA